MYIYMYIYVYIYVYIYICIYVYIYTHMTLTKGFLLQLQYWGTEAVAKLLCLMPMQKILMQHNQRMVAAIIVRIIVFIKI